MTRARQLDLDDWVGAAVERAGYGPDEGLVVGVQVGGAPAVHRARGRTRTGAHLGAGTLVCTASLAKQVTAACAALLVRQGQLDLEAPLARWMPELPSWAAAITVRHLVHHTSGLPDLPRFEELERRQHDRTTEAVLHALNAVGDLDAAPGSVHRYCNAGYVCLAAVIERAADQDFAQHASDRVFTPLGMGTSGFWAGPGAHPPGAAPTERGMPAALSLGDGGLWSTAVDLLRWNQALQRDELGVSSLLHARGHLDDGTPLDYAWGIGVRTRCGQRVHRHGGMWAGLSTQLLRVPDRAASAVIIAMDHREERTAALADAVLDHLTA